MDETKDHILIKQGILFFLTGKLKDATPLYPLSQVYTTRKLVALVTMECETEDACNVELFWDCFNEVLWKEKKDGKTKLQENRSVELDSSERTASEKISATQTIYLLRFPRPRCTCKPQSV